MDWLRLYLLSVAFYGVYGVFLRVLFWFYFSEQLAGIDSFALLSAWVFGLRFDLALAALLGFVTILFAVLLPKDSQGRRRGATVQIIINFCLSTAMIGDLLYFAESGRHAGYEITELTQGLDSMIFTAWVSAPGLIIFSFFIYLLMTWLVIKTPGFRPQTPSHFRKTTAIVFGLFVLSFVVVRGGFSGLPLSPNMAFQVGHAGLSQFALNGGYNAAYFLLSRPDKLKKRTISNRPSIEVEKSHLADLQPPAPRSGAGQAAKSMNVVFIMLESWSATRMHSFGGAQKTTPNFDRLQQRGVSVAGMLAGGHRTTEGLFTSLTALQNPLGHAIPKTQLNQYDYPSWVQVLRDQGWATAFFQGTHRETIGTGALAQKLGFEHSYGKESVSDVRVEKNTWGLQDPDIYRFALKEAHALKEPFVLGINTNSTHDLLLPDGVKPAFGLDDRSAQLNSVLHYADAALGQFVKDYEQQKWRLPTLFVLMADHTSRVTGSPMDHYRIPFALFSTDDRVHAKHIDQIVAQRDVAPTILDVLAVADPRFFGRSLLVPGYSAADYYHHHVLGWVEGDRAVEVDLRAENSIRAYRLVGKYRLAKPTAMTSVHQQMAARAKAFTALAQDYLFAGKADQFSIEMMALKPTP